MHIYRMTGIRTNIQAGRQTETYMYQYIQSCTHTDIQVYVHTYVHTYSHTQAGRHRDRLPAIHAHTYIQTATCIHT